MKYKLISSLLLTFLLIFSCKKETPEGKVPIVETSDVTSIGENLAYSGGRVVSEGSSEVIARGVCWSKKNPPTISDSKAYGPDIDGTFVSKMENLRLATTYYVMAFAKNSSGFGYGEIKTFSTPGGLPTAETLPASNVGLNSARLNSNVNGNYYGATFSFEWGLTSSYGKVSQEVYSWRSNALLKPEFVNIYIYGLTRGTVYHYRIKAVNDVGTTYGNDATFSTTETDPASIIFNPDLTYGSVTDIDGNFYRTIKIGTQTWMAENLRVKRFNNGTKIPRMTDIVSYWNPDVPAYGWYNNDSATYFSVYGALYNWYTVDPDIRDVKNVCPVGWHVPGETEWNFLINTLGGNSSAAIKLKETTTTHWQSLDAGVTNETGFTALPGGYDSNGHGDFEYYGSNGFWWSSTINNIYLSPYWIDILSESADIIKTTGDKHAGLSVRCVKD
jgi:uncharacterized protein (TIGR02145 family)